MVPKSKIYPAFGMYHYDTRIAEIRDDLPKLAQLFIIEHERGHSNDHGEIMSTLVAMVDYPIGFIITVLMSLLPYRLAYYWRRITLEADY